MTFPWPSLAHNLAFNTAGPRQAGQQQPGGWPRQVRGPQLQGRPQGDKAAAQARETHAGEQAAAQLCRPAGGGPGER